LSLNTECRERCVDQLHALGALPRWMLEECQYDANTDLRAKVTQWVQSADVTSQHDDSAVP
jgi:hypothetical protein